MPSWVDGGAADSAADRPVTDGVTARAGDGQAQRPNGVGDGGAGAAHGPFGVWGSGGPALAHWRPGLVSLLAAAGVVVLLVVAAWMVGGSGEDHPEVEVDWADPESVATVFVERYAVHDPAACELVTSPLRGRLANEGRCVGPVRGTTPRLAVIGSQTCGGVHDFDAAVAPAGEVGMRFVSVSLQRAGGTSWLVRSLLPIGDCRVLATRPCEEGR